jgi:hypothetical protein
VSPKWHVTEKTDNGKRGVVLRDNPREIVNFSVMYVGSSASVLPVRKDLGSSQQQDHDDVGIIARIWVTTQITLYHYWDVGGKPILSSAIVR